MSQSPYRLLALDVDGTLIRRDGVIDPRDLTAIAELRRRDVHVSLVTGRLYAGTRPPALELGLTGPLVCADGAQIVSLSEDRELSYTGICAETLEQLHDVLAPRGLSVFPFFDDTVVLDHQGAFFEPYLRTWTPNVQQVDSALAHSCWQDPRGLSVLVVIGPRETITEVFGELTDGALDILRFDMGPEKAMSSLILHARGVSKAKGLETVAEHYGCRMDEVVAVGDWLNDRSMLEAAGLSFAMGHAPELVKQSAKEQLSADAETGGGVAEAISRAWP